MNNTPSGDINDASASISNNFQQRCSTASITEDDVDLQLWKLDGKIQRKRDEKL